MCIERRRFTPTMASEWQTAFVVSHKMPWCALLTDVKNYNKCLEKLQDFFFKTETKTKCWRPRLHDPRPRTRPRLSFLSSKRLETKTLVSRTTSLLKSVPFGSMKGVRCRRRQQKQWLDNIRVDWSEYLYLLNNHTIMMSELSFVFGINGSWPRDTMMMMMMKYVKIQQHRFAFGCLDICWELSGFKNSPHTLKHKLN